MKKENVFQKNLNGKGRQSDRRFGENELHEKERHCSWRKVETFRKTYIPRAARTSIICTGSSACGTPPHGTDCCKYPAKWSGIRQNHKQIDSALVKGESPFLLF